MEIIKLKDWNSLKLKLNCNQRDNRYLYVSTNSLAEKGKPKGFLVKEGRIFTCASHFASLLVYYSNIAKIQTDFTFKEIAKTRFIISGSHFIPEDEKWEVYPLFPHKEDNVYRILIGIKYNEPFLIHGTATHKKLYKYLFLYEMEEALLISSGKNLFVKKGHKVIGSPTPAMLEIKI